MRILTAASSNHFEPLLDFLSSVAAHAPKAQVVTYDLGLSIREVADLSARADVRRFAFERYPEHARDLMTYAWKPIIVHDFLEETGGPVLWCDAGNLVHGDLEDIRDQVIMRGIYVPKGRSLIKQRTMRPTMEALQMPPGMGDWVFRHAALVGLDKRRLGLAAAWKAAALDPAIIAPPGHMRAWHHYDQSVLSILAYKLAWAEGWQLEDRFFDVSVCNDDKARRAGLLPPR